VRKLVAPQYPSTIRRYRLKLIKVRFVLPYPGENTPKKAREGLVIRAQATLSGRCACGGNAGPMGHDKQLKHEPDCPAIAQAVERALEAGRVRWEVVDLVLPVSALPGGSTR